MNNNTETVSSISIHRAALHGYLILLVGLLFGVESALSALTTGMSLFNIGGIVVGLYGIGGGALGYFRPEGFPRGTEPSPTYLYVLAGISTLAFGFAILPLVL